MNRFVCWILTGLMFFCGVIGNAQEATESHARTEYLLSRADLMMLQTFGDEDGKVKISRVQDPILKFKNPLYEAQSDGVLVVWVADEVPVAFASYSIRKEKVIFRELATSSDVPLRCSIGDRVVWAPEPKFTRRPLDSTTTVPSDARVRLRIMKRQGERFNNGNHRILPTPLYRYQSEEQGIVDGAVFALSDTNDPEMLILIEAAKPSENAAAIWRYTLARMNSQPRQVRLDGQVVWELSGYWNNPKSAKDPYVEAMDSELPEHLRLDSVK
ncbi:MAG: hypothetical protein KDB00_05750 [Planctomycetales bacterium]|nr:hypothetical protein [Planctomycetales bacterium]